MPIAVARISDVSLLASLHARCFTDGWGAESFETLLRSDNGTGLLAETSQGVNCGFAVLRFAADECEILTLGVLPGSRRQGLGKALVEAALQNALSRDARSVFLEVDAGNLAAVSLYRGFGFQDVGLRKGYYRNCEAFADALVLRRALDGMGISVSPQ